VAVVRRVRVEAVEAVIVRHVAAHVIGRHDLAREQAPEGKREQRRNQVILAVDPVGIAAAVAVIIIVVVEIQAAQGHRHWCQGDRLRHHGNGLPDEGHRLGRRHKTPSETASDQVIAVDLAEADHAAIEFTNANELGALVEGRDTAAGAELAIFEAVIGPLQLALIAQGLTTGDPKVPAIGAMRPQVLAVHILRAKLLAVDPLGTQFLAVRTLGANVLAVDPLGAQFLATGPLGPNLLAVHALNALNAIGPLLAALHSRDALGAFGTRRADPFGPLDALRGHVAAALGSGSALGTAVLARGLGAFAPAAVFVAPFRTCRGCDRQRGHAGGE
jgi:hypothetical protein